MKKVMIKNIINSLLLVVVLGVSSCNDQLADELFEKRTYLIENETKIKNYTIKSKMPLDLKSTSGCNIFL